MALTIISIGHIASTGNTVTFEDKSCKIKNKSGKVIGNILASTNSLYKVKHSHMASSTDKQIEHANIFTLHQRLSHISADTIHRVIRNNAIQGIQLLNEGFPIICDSCEYAKLTCKAI